jgi:hypothetical protein
MLEHVHLNIEPGLKRRAEQASQVLELRNLAAFIRMAIAEKVTCSSVSLAGPFRFHEE